MQHFVRPLALAGALDPARYDIHFHAPERYHGWLAGKGFTVGALQSMPGEQFLKNLARGAPLFPAGVLREYVSAERRLLQALKPDLVIGDLRFSLPVSARLEGVPCAVLANAYWSPQAARPGIIPELPITRIIPPAWLEAPYRLAEARALAVHVRAINVVRRDHGLPPLPPDPRHMYTSGDHVLYADVPEFVPIPNLPPTHRYVGPCTWELPGEKPPWWDSMIADPRPKVLISLGSSGPVRILPRLLEVLSGFPVAPVLTTSGRALPIGETAAGPYVAPLLPFAETAANARLVISHGGSSGFYPALAAGTPVLAIPSNADQQMAAAVLAESGAGLSVRVEEASPRRLKSALEALLLPDPSPFGGEARRWAGVFARYDTPALFRSFVFNVLQPL